MNSRSTPDPTSRRPRPLHLPRGLTATVSDVEEVLGQVVAAAEGDELYRVVEGVRREMVAFREADRSADRAAALDRAHERLRALSIPQRQALARAYTLYLQLVNVCENAYRTHRLRARRNRDDQPDTPPGSEGGPPRSPGARITFVLTAHPTESRSPANIGLLRRVQDHVLESLERGEGIDRREVENLVHLAWRAGTHPRDKPSVDDEAAHLFSMLTDPILTAWIALDNEGHEVRLRSWVGGDKDGHPGVGPEQTRASLQRSRDRLRGFVRNVLLPPLADDVRLADDAAPELEALRAALEALDLVESGDGVRVGRLRHAIEAFQAKWRSCFGIEHPAVRRLVTLLDVFPALVVPLELREERGRFSADGAIAGMMRTLAEIADGGAVDGYARAVVVSMTLEAADLLEAQALVDDVWGDGGPEGGAGLPVVPLFELPDVLERAPDILEDTWADRRFRAAVEQRGHLEVMLGYSDTAKRMGMLASRVALHDAMRRIGEWAEAAGVRPLFFHGHGGSVGRGGGRIEDLAATWPPRARTPYKYTVQGEMVERTFSTPEILRSLVEKVARVQHDPPTYRGVSDVTRALAECSRAAFEQRVESEDFRELLAQATPYTRLEALTIGSRPTSRSGGGLEKLRAIPWVLCWTQSRLLLHAWLGAGQAWRDLRQREGIERELEQARETDPLFRSYSRLLSFTMAKTAPAIWDRYRSELASARSAHQAAELERDFEAAIDLACRAVGGDSLLPDRPWLEESIRYRAPMIHPLNLMQIDLLQQSGWSEDEVRLFRETVTGIAAGMLTTG